MAHKGMESEKVSGDQERDKRNHEEAQRFWDEIKANRMALEKPEDLKTRMEKEK